MANQLPSRIDVHSHFLPPFYRDALIAAGHSKPDGMPAIPPWSVEAHLEVMKAANITRSILSISSPGCHLTPGKGAERKDLTRRCNAYAADLKQKYPQKIGFWASLPLPDAQDALEEIDLAVQEGCDGFVLMTNYHGHMLGDPKFDTVFEKLNRLGAIVFIHPTTPCIAHANSVDTVTKALPFGDRYPVPMFEFLFDTSRAVINLFYSGTVDRCPDIKVIVPHVGGTFPPLISRFTAFGALVPGTTKLSPPQVRQQMMEQFYFDLAGVIFDGEKGDRGQLKAFMNGFDIPRDKLLYGSDFPFTNHGAVLLLANRMQDGLENLFNEKEREAVYERNAERLLERKLKK